MVKAKKSVLISAVLLLLASFLVAGVALYAWFTMNDAQLDPITIQILGVADMGISIEQVDGQVNSGNDKYPIYPHTKVELGASAYADIADFGVILNFERLDEESFRNQFLKNPQMLEGIYQKGQTIVGLDDNNQPINKTVFRDYDLNAYLTLSNINDVEHKIKFLYEFAREVKVQSLIQISCVFGEGASARKVPLVYSAEKNLYYSATPLSIDSKTDFAIHIEYAKNPHTGECYYPTFENTGGTLFPVGTYRALNYNCFSGQSTLVAFDKDVVTNYGIVR